MHAVIGIPIVSDILDWTGGALKWLDDNVIKRIPGSEWVKAAVEQGKEWLVDFSKTEIGFRTLQLIANNAYQRLAWMIGPQVASIVWATPGMIRGDAFSDAYTKEVIARIEGLIAFIKGGPVGSIAAYYGASGAKTNDEVASMVTAQFGDDFKSVVDNEIFKKAMAEIIGKTRGLAESEIRKQLRALDQTPKDLTNRLKKKIPTLRPDVVAVAMNGALHAHVFDVNGEYRFDNGQPNFDPQMAAASVTDPHGRFNAQMAAAANLDGFSRPKKPVPFGSTRFSVHTADRSLASYAAILALLTSPFWGAALAAKYRRRRA